MSVPIRADYSIANVIQRNGRPAVSFTTRCPGCDNDGLVLFDHPKEKRPSNPSPSLKALLRTQPGGFRTGMPCPRCALGRMESDRVTGGEGGDLYRGVDLAGVTFNGGRSMRNTLRQAVAS